VNPLVVEEDTDTYEEYVLDKGYNAWAGQVYQSGWAIGGIVFQGKGDALTVAKDLGYDIEAFQKARYLEIEMPERRGHYLGRRGRERFQRRDRDVEPAADSRRLRRC